MKNNDDVNYVYDKTEQITIGNKTYTVRVRANKPSEEALRRFGLMAIRIMKEVEKREAENKVVRNGKVIDGDKK